MIALLQEYLQIKTAHPQPNYHAAVALFKKYALIDGFLIGEFVLPSKNPVLILTYEGTNPLLPSLALNHHMDVVPADNTHEWTHPPFAGTIHENHIIGRGTQDMKGVGVVHYAALRELKENNILLERTVHLIMVPDEERGGFYGTKEFIEHPEFVSLNIGYVLDEGMPSGNDKELLIKIEERTPIQIKVTSKGLMGHASELQHENSAHTLINFLSDIVSFHREQQALTDDPGTLFSMNITSLSTDNLALNVIPSQSEATIDIRVPSHRSLLQAIELFEVILKKHPTISHEIIATSVERCTPTPLDSALYKACAEAMQIHGILPKPFAFQATTDARFYSNKKIETIGMTPFCVTPNLHGTNESIRIEDITLGKTIICTFLTIFCKKRELNLTN